MIQFRRYTPLSIRHLVKCIWYMEVPADGGVYEEEIIPDGHHELIFYLDDSTPRTRSSVAGWGTHPAASVVGQSLQSNRIKMFPGVRLYGIRFYPHTLYALFRMPVALFTSAIVPLDDVLKHHGFWDQISDDADRTFAALERYLARILQRELAEQPGYRYIDYSTARIFGSRGSVPVKELVRKTGITTKYHDELFKKYVGITPKLLGSVLKFNSFVHYRACHREKTLTECAHEAGYYDQSHLIKSCYCFTGFSPSGYFQGGAEISETFAGL
jgi:AraC-like DNA-binding protein